MGVTFEALMYSLRNGVDVLTRADVRHRLAQLDKEQLLEACARLQRHKPRIAKQWTDDEVKQLVAMWARQCSTKPQSSSC